MENRSFTPSGEKTAMEDMDALRGDVERVLDLTRAYVEGTGGISFGGERPRTGRQVRLVEKAVCSATTLFRLLNSL